MRTIVEKGFNKHRFNDWIHSLIDSRQLNGNTFMTPWNLKGTGLIACKDAASLSPILA